MRTVVRFITFLVLFGTWFLGVPAAIAETIRFSLAQLPIGAESETKGVWIDLIKAMHEVDPSVDVEWVVVPFARSIQNVLDGTADIHFPLLRPPPEKLEGKPYRLSKMSFYRVNFVLYANKGSDLTLDNIESHKVETERAHVELFDFPLGAVSSPAIGLRMVDARRIDGFLFSDTACDPIVLEQGLKNIRRILFGQFDVAAVLPKQSAKDLEGYLERNVAVLKVQGRYDKIMAPLNEKYSE